MASYTLPPAAGLVGYVVYGVDVLVDANHAFLAVSPGPDFAGQTSARVMYSKLDTQSPQPADTYRFSQAPPGQGFQLAPGVLVPTARYYYENGFWWVQRYTSQAQSPQKMQGALRTAHNVGILFGENGDYVGLSPAPNRIPPGAVPVSALEMQPGDSNPSAVTVFPGGGNPLEGICFVWVWYELYEDGQLTDCGWVWS